MNRVFGKDPVIAKALYRKDLKLGQLSSNYRAQCLTARPVRNFTHCYYAKLRRLQIARRRMRTEFGTLRLASGF
jgi:hypothetical protein